MDSACIDLDAIREYEIDSKMKKAFQEWLSNTAGKDNEVLRSLLDDKRELEDSFFDDLAFGTGGLRGIIGLGPNRMNRYTVARATQGLSLWLNEHFPNPSVAIARDSRHGSEEFIRVIVEVLAANNIIAMVYPRMEPTPTLSFAVRELNCSAGICITASHNPAEYNGYKVYNSDGCQITTDTASQVQEAINSVDTFNDVKRIPFDEAEAKGLLSWIDDSVLDRYLEAVLNRSNGIDCSSLRVAYTPLHGTGTELLPKVLHRLGIEELAIEATQSNPDGDFPTCPRPNPEEEEALALGLNLAKNRSSDILLATDPDADRLGVAVRHNDDYTLLTGNDIGILLLDHLCTMTEESGSSLVNRVVVTTIVSTPMADNLAMQKGFQLRRTLTGFKYIGEQIGLLDKQGEANRFLFGFEESYGFLSGTYVRDKDAMVAAMLVCEAAAWHLKQGRDLVEAIGLLKERYGHHASSLLSISYPGAKGRKRMEATMVRLYNNPPAQLAGKRLIHATDYRGGAPMPVIGSNTNNAPTLPKANVLELQYADSCKIIIRPSGTEPKIKAYASVVGKTSEHAQESLRILTEATKTLLSAL